MTDSLSPEEWTCETNSVDETHRLGSLLGRNLEPGSVVALSGNLGAGKTHFTQGIAIGLDIDRRLVNSPTFSLVQEYAGRLPVFHFDTYRVGSVNEFLDLGFDEYLASRGVCIIEWAERVAEILPDDLLRIHLTTTSPTTRQLTWRATGTQSQRILAGCRSGFSNSPPDLQSRPAK